MSTTTTRKAKIFLDGPYFDVDKARAARVRYAKALTQNGLAKTYGVSVGGIPGQPGALAVWLHDNSIGTSYEEEDQRRQNVQNE